MITYYYEDIEPLDIQEKNVSGWIKSTAAVYGKKIGEISYIFCSDERILEVNKQYLDHDYYTDIITFDYTQGNILGGDIFVSVDTVKSNAGKFGQSFGKELHRVIIHGILHLCGQTDKTPEEQQQMTAKENLALDAINFIEFY
ncbi:rRNA maturation RNase YbeY [Paludibacter sp. 221]|uniref:rRNA maturation RNase YbeY n=1 Tax=Paludibacter sp. 221 TaxID=2302939 RepID=UPI0013D5E8EB|nr:rRNA maturation RNase YbeY [Paludibacter sp. 221]NDV47222.1 rRNA maturation RNase YbeY [Paludibacter sp. 221]